MPAKNVEKTYVENGYYHLYNRGVEKRVIFQDRQDYSTFLSYLKTYLSLKNKREILRKLANHQTSYKERDRILRSLRLNNFAESLKLLAYCLVPNHFHLLVKQTLAETIDKFMNSLGTRYVVYFNKKQQRVGPLFQGVYKAVLVKTEGQLLHLSRYIHHQALAKGDPFKGVPLQGETLGGIGELPSSYRNYLGEISQDWVKPKEILSYFRTAKRTSLKDVLSYQSFVEDYKRDEAKILEGLILE